MTRFILTWILSGLAFGLAWGAFMALEFEYWGFFRAGLPAGLVFGLALASFQAWVSRSKAAQAQMKLPLQEGERLLMEGLANHRLNREYRGGFLRLTNRRLAFRPHASNAQNDPLDIPLSHLAGAETMLNLSFLPNGLRVKTTDGDSHDFVVCGRTRWRDAIRRAGDSSGAVPGLSPEP